MIDNNQKTNQKINPPSNEPRPQASPVLQASPSGGVVATLQPGEQSFEDKIRTESERKDNFVYQSSAPDFIDNSQPGIKIPEMEGSAVVSTEAQTTEEKVQAPATVLNYKIGNDLEKKKKNKWFFPVIFGLFSIFIIGSIIWYFYNRNLKIQQAKVEPPKETVITTLEYWGLWEPSHFLTQVLKDFELSHPGISVNYMKKDITDYWQSLNQAIGTASGPDVFRYHASWREDLQDKLAPMPEKIMTPAQYGQTFYPVMSQQLRNQQGEIQGVPLMYDSLSLLYNKELYRQANLELPSTWAQFRANAATLTRKNQEGYIEIAGAAMGLADNVDFASDIITLLAIQSGIDFKNPDVKIIEDVLTFYTNFYNSSAQRTWDETFADNSTLAFSRGEVAMIIAPSWIIHDVLGINPNLEIGVASIPQLDIDRPKELASYWVEGVSAASPRQEAAWQLLSYLSSEEVLQALYEQQASARLFGEIYPRSSMADLLATNQYIQPYLFRAGQAIGYPANDKTFDEGQNREKKEAILNAINVLTKKTSYSSNPLEVAATLAKALTVATPEEEMEQR